MPASFEHEVLVELFRKCGPLAPELLRACTSTILEHDHVEVTSIDLSQVASAEYRADAVVELRDRTNAVTAGVIVEIQLHKDLDKRFSWPLYVAALRAKLRRPATLLVLTRDRAMARWAAERIELGHPGFGLAPIVIELRDVPRSIDPVQAHKLPELAVLSAIAHPALDTAATAFSAIEPLPADQKKLYCDVIRAKLPAALRQILEASMIKGYEYQSEFARLYYGEGHEKGLSQGREEGLSQGREEGLRTALLALARMRLPAVTDDDVTAIGALRDEGVLLELIGALGQASDATEMRAAVDLAIRRSRGA
jgi:hypothetical protein